jgi:adenylate cyclase
VEADYGSSGMLISCYTALGDSAGTRRAAEMTLARVEKVLALDRNNASAMGHGSDALAVLGQYERAKEWMGRAVLVEPDNLLMRYNFACALSIHMKDVDGALAMVGPVLAKAGIGLVNHAKVDPDFDNVREDLRFKAIIEAAEARLAAQA